MRKESPPRGRLHQRTLWKRTSPLLPPAPTGPNHPSRSTVVLPVSRSIFLILLPRRIISPGVRLAAHDSSPFCTGRLSPESHCLPLPPSPSPHRRAPPALDSSRCLAPILPGLIDGSREGARDTLLERSDSSTPWSGSSRVKSWISLVEDADGAGGVARVAPGVDGGSAGLLLSLLLPAPETDAARRR